MRQRRKTLTIVKGEHVTPWSWSSAASKIVALDNGTAEEGSNLQGTVCLCLVCGMSFFGVPSSIKHVWTQCKPNLTCPPWTWIGTYRSDQRPEPCCSAHDFEDLEAPPHNDNDGWGSPAKASLSTGSPTARPKVSTTRTPKPSGHESVTWLESGEDVLLAAVQMRLNTSTLHVKHGTASHTVVGIDRSGISDCCQGLALHV